ncbi:MAG: hypothetical protein K2G01_07430, partial [Paramuribaculum sp.]|nr:hypothetical protein [Paramuribaculum sp.]
GIVFLIPAFAIMPEMFGTTGIWLSLSVSEFLCTLSISVYYLVDRQRSPKAKSRIQTIKQEPIRQ